MIASLISAAFAASLVTCFAPEQDFGLPWPTVSRPTIPCWRNADDLEEALARAAPARQRHRALCQRIGADHPLRNRTSTTIFQMSCARSFTALAVAASPTSSKIAFLSKSSRKPYGSSFASTE